MKIDLSGDVRGLSNGLQNLLANYVFPTCRQENFAVEAHRLSANSSVSLRVSTGNGLRIDFRKTSDFFRALPLLLENCQKKNYEHEETALFEGRSAMLDLSRNAVLTVSEAKRLLCFMALSGFNRCYLYMEDTYELPGYPYFGYLRGRLTQRELKEIDDFAASLGIEAIPCIETLAHLRNTLKWDYAVGMRDTDDILLVGEEKTYQFLEAMFSTLKQTFRTNRIHIGMDEAMGLGTGCYLQKNGFHKQYDIMIRHLDRVCALARKYGLTPMIWDDMFYRSHDENLDYYNMADRLTDEDIAAVPDDLVLVYWDYYHTKPEEYDCLLAMRDRFPNDITFAGGIWSWNGFVPTLSKTFATTNAALPACRRHKVKEVMATVWGDNGAETPFETILPGLILFGEHFYGQPYDNDAIDQRCRFLTGVSLSDFAEIEQLDLLPGSETPNLQNINPSKGILYQDTLLGAFDYCLHRPDIPDHFLECGRRLAKTADRAGAFQPLFAMYAKLAELLAEKSQIGIRIHKAYRENDRETLSDLASETLPHLEQKVRQFREAFAAVWFHERKGPGFEVIDIRLGGVMSRAETAAARISAYLNGEIPAVDELEEEQLPYDMRGQGKETYAAINSYQNIATQNPI